MIRLKIDNKEIEVSEGATVLEAAIQAGINIPSLCHLKGNQNHPSCMVCLVKDNRSGNFVPSCAMQVSDGMDFSASDPDVIIVRRQSLELLLSDHVGDCEAPCSLACPAGMNIPLMNRLIGDGRFTEALKVVKEEIALPYILGFICPAPCEKVCRRKQIDEPVSICLLKRFSASAGSENRELLELSKLQSSGMKVAIIGSGPAGLAAAYYLQIYGHSCDVYEKSSAPGGTMRHSISEEILPKKIIDTEVELIRSMGAVFYYNSLITAEVFTSQISGKYNSVIVATGDIITDNYLAEIISVTNSGYQVNEKDLSSSMPGVFVCGSAIRPNKMAVRSVAQGKTVADSVHKFLHKEQFEKPAKMFNSRFDKLFPEEYSEYLKESISSSRVKPAGGYLSGFSPDEAVKEAMRCLHCDCRKQDNCKLRTHSQEYKIERKRFLVSERRLMTKQMQHHLVVFEPEKCIKCGLCVEISARENEKYGLAFEGRGFDAVVTTPLGIPFNEGLSHSAKKCITACPTGALSFR